MPNAINENGIVVGTGEIEATLSTVRRRVGFMYDTTKENPEFINLNDAVSCDSQYFIIEANDVTDSGEVLATALKTEEYVDSDGETQTREVAVAIKINPIDGELNNCREEENKIEKDRARRVWFWLVAGSQCWVRLTFSRRIPASKDQKIIIKSS